MSSRRLQNWLRTYAEHTEISEAPRPFHFWTGISVIAAALRRRVWIDQKLFQWTPNFYIILVGPPGIATKSTSMRVGFRILRQVPDIEFGPQSMSWQGLLKAFSDSCTMVEFEDMYLPMSCITCDVSELGTFLKASDGDLVTFLTDMWDGQLGGWKQTLKHSDDVILENPWLNVMGCTTPSWLRENFTSSMIFGGLTSRCVFVWGEKKEALIPYPGDLVQDEEYAKREEDLTNDLQHISNLLGPMRLDVDAKIWGKAWYEQHWSTRGVHVASERFDGYISRKQTHLHKLAMILSAAERDDRIITSDMLKLSDAILTEIEADMIKVFESIGTTDAVKHIDEILSIVRRSKTIGRTQLWRTCMRHMSERDFRDAIDAAVEAQYIIVRNVKGKIHVTAVKRD